MTETPGEQAAAPHARAKSHVAPTTSIRAATPEPRRLSRKTLMLGALTLCAIVAFAIVNGLSHGQRRAGDDADAQQALQTATPPENIRERPANYDLTQLRPPVDDGRNYLWGDHPVPAGSPVPATTPAPETSTARPSAFETETEAARTSSILFGQGSEHAASTSQASLAAGASGPHSAFVSSQAGRDDGVLDATYLPPRSPYVVQSGSTISAALITALNSDQPGRVIAQVSENVFDTVTGEHLLIPQGARLVGAYDAATSYGEQRLLVIWNRLIMPNGWSIALRGMAGTDAAGASGLHGEADAHIGRIAVASLISGVLGVAANSSQDHNSDRLAESVGDAAAQQAAQSGSRIVDRELDVRPTLRIAAGARVRVLVSQDLILRPYRP